MTHTVELEKVRIGIRKAVSPYLMDAHVRVRDSLIADFVVELSGYLFGESVDSYLIEYPADWWQAFKERWFSDWLRARYPVNYKVHHIDLKLIYTKFKAQMPEEQSKVIKIEWVEQATEHVSDGGE